MNADDLAMELWEEQIVRGLGEPGECATREHLDDWWANRTIREREVYDRAAAGDVSALAQVRTEAGLPILS